MPSSLFIISGDAILARPHPEPRRSRESKDAMLLMQRASSDGAALAQSWCAAWSTALALL